MSFIYKIISFLASERSINALIVLLTSIMTDPENNLENCRGQKTSDTSMLLLILKGEKYQKIKL